MNSQELHMAPERRRLVRRRATVRALLERRESSAESFVARWGRAALLRLPAAELVERSLLQFGFSATAPRQPGRGDANQALLMLRSFREMEIDFFVGRGARTLLGRASTADVVLDHASVSKLHASLSWDERGVLLEDLQSLNGTKLNGRALIATTKLRDGDLIRLGDAAVVFVTTPTLFLQLESVRHCVHGGH